MGLWGTARTGWRPRDRVARVATNLLESKQQPQQGGNPPTILGVAQASPSGAPTGITTEITQLAAAGGQPASSPPVLCLSAVDPPPLPCPRQRPTNRCSRGLIREPLLCLRSGSQRAKVAAKVPTNHAVCSWAKCAYSDLSHDIITEPTCFTLLQCAGHGRHHIALAVVHMLEGGAEDGFKGA